MKSNFVSKAISLPSKRGEERAMQSYRDGLWFVGREIVYNKFVGVLIAIFGVLQCLDWATTAYGWTAGVPEANPIMAAVLARVGIYGHGALKILGTLVVYAALKPKLLRPARLPFLAAANGLMAWVVLTNFQVLL